MKILNGYTVDKLSCGENRSRKFNKMVEQRILDNSQPQNSNKNEVDKDSITKKSPSIKEKEQLQESKSKWSFRFMQKQNSLIFMI